MSSYKAVARLERDGTAADDERVDEARRNLVRLVDGMVQDAMFRGATQLHEDTLAAALKKLCPLIPFC